MPKICLDAGHNNSGADTGAAGNNLREELLTLDICQRIKALLELNDFEVVMTREGDFVNGPHNTVNESLQTRCNIANKAEADLFISVHINAGGGTGQEIYICGGGGQAEKFAKISLYYLLQQCAWKDRGVKTSNFLVLENTTMPAILTENGFIDNAADASLLRTEDFRQKIAVAHAKAVCDYYKQTYNDKQAPVSSPTAKVLSATVNKISAEDDSHLTDKTKQALVLLKQAIKLLEESR